MIWGIFPFFFIFLKYERPLIIGGPFEKFKKFFTKIAFGYLVHITNAQEVDEFVEDVNQIQ